jgi:hypothetical protein
LMKKKKKIRVKNPSNSLDSSTESFGSSLADVDIEADTSYYFMLSLIFVS